MIPFKISRFILPAFFALTACNNNDSTTRDKQEEKVAVTTSEQKTIIPGGENLFERKCIACHGVDGTAAIGGATDLQKSKLETDAIIEIITNGRAGMPSFKSSTSGNELKQLAAYIKSLHK